MRFVVHVHWKTYPLRQRLRDRPRLLLSSVEAVSSRGAAKRCSTYPVGITSPGKVKALTQLLYVREEFASAYYAPIYFANLKIAMTWDAICKN
ncbi:hypothetical protein Trydic_g14822 [Trypoxylus dichotomus]